MSQLSAAWATLSEARRQLLVTLQADYKALAESLGSPAPPAEALISSDDGAAQLDAAVAAWDLWALRNDAPSVNVFIGLGDAPQITPGWPAILTRYQRISGELGECVAAIKTAYEAIAGDALLSRAVDDRPALWWLDGRAQRATSPPRPPSISPGLGDGVLPLVLAGLAVWALLREGADNVGRNTTRSARCMDCSRSNRNAYCDCFYAHL